MVSVVLTTTSTENRAMCQVDSQDDHEDALERLEARKAAVEREIAQVKTDRVWHDVNTRQATTKAEER